MIAAALQSLRWSLSLGAKIGRVVPWLTGLLVIVALISQIAMLLASFLPLKVVILLGSEGMPSYLPSSLKALGKDALIGMFSMVTVGFYVLHLMAEKLVTIVTGRATVVLLKRSHKLVLFERQDEVAAGAYQRFSRALAGGMFVALAISGLVWIYLEMAMVILGYLFTCLVFFWGGSSVSASFRQRLEEKLAPTLNLAAGVGFFVSFGFLVLDFILLSPPAVIPAIVSLLLTRMIMLKVSSGIVDISSLSRQRSKLDALFFHGKVFLPQGNERDNGVWSMIQPEERGGWIEAIFREHVQDWCGLERVEWYQSGVPNVAALTVWDHEGRSYLLKLFDQARRGLALHEATLTGERVVGLPAPELIANTQVRQFQCLVYELPVGRKPDRDETKRLMESVRGRVLWAEPAASLVLQYTRSKPMLWQRLDEQIVERLGVCASSDQERLLAKRLSSQLYALQEHLRQLPLVLINPDINVSSIYLTDSDTLLLNWGRWAIDPVGSGWRDGEKPIAQLSDYLNKAAEHRPSLKSVASESAELSALTFSFEAKCSRQLFSEAFELLPGILDRLELVLGQAVGDALGASQ
ncbi:hypothetical protein [Marinobacter lipolyticus]|uniref:hypothetical protein n=1 Tax=Marinobacter lipolyticus TaxID=209639 RepID=UPI003A8FB0F8